MTEPDKARRSTGSNPGRLWHGLGSVLVAVVFLIRSAASDAPAPVEPPGDLPGLSFSSEPPSIESEPGPGQAIPLGPEPPPATTIGPTTREGRPHASTNVARPKTVAVRAPLPIEVNPGLRIGIDDQRGLTDTEVQRVTSVVDDALVEARALAQRESVVGYFVAEYGVRPGEVLTNQIDRILITRLKNDHMAELEDRVILFDVHCPLAAIKARTTELRRAWVERLAVVTIHELVHRAAVISGRHWEPAPGQEDEGKVGERKMGIWIGEYPEFRFPLVDLLAIKP